MDESSNKPRDTTLGVSRYQPAEMQRFFGRDNTYAGAILVEIAVLQTLAEIGVISEQEISHLDEDALHRLYDIKTSEVELVEKKTKHDVRALVQVIQSRLDPSLASWVHLMLTSYDPLDTGRAYQYVQAYREGLRPSIIELVTELSAMVGRFADTRQVGRTHGQHALPITAGFWMATILYRLVYNWQQMDHHANLLVGKISGAVGAYNAQKGLGIFELCGDVSFEERVLSKLGLKPSPISTQILPPDPVAYFLFSVLQTSSVLAQFGCDCRHLMRTEISEVIQPKKKDEVGSSTMAHKNNPTLFENIEGRYRSNIGEFVKVLLVNVSEHQRDLVNSSVMREFPSLLVNLQHQLNTLLRKDEETKEPFIRRIIINKDALKRNLDMSGDLILAEPLYIALQMGGYEGDAHKLINDVVAPRAIRNKSTLLLELANAADHDTGLKETMDRVPQQVWDLFQQPSDYIGDAVAKSHQIMDLAESTIKELTR